MKRVNNYNLQYWLYAILNRTCGRSVKMVRDSLHSRYSVNRHGFRVESQTLALTYVTNKLLDTLVAAGFKQEDKTQWVKVTDSGRIYVTVNLGLDMHKNLTMYVIGSVYR